MEQPKEEHDEDEEQPKESSISTATRIPQFVFIIPYRDREQQKTFFIHHMKMILEDYEPHSYEIYFVHQTDTRDFNRGAMKNIGFLYVKNKYPDNYQNITFVFNDIDTMPFTKNFLSYPTKTGTIKHFYGYMFALGGIVSITGADFEKINGFPNYWSWGYEDNELNNRAVNNRIQIDRSQFYPIMDKNIFQMKDGLIKVINRNEFDRYVGNSKEGIDSIKDVNYQYDKSSNLLNVSSFSTGIEPSPKFNLEYDIRKGSKPFGNINKGYRGRGGSMKMVF